MVSLCLYSLAYRLKCLTTIPPILKKVSDIEVFEIFVLKFRK